MWESKDSEAKQFKNVLILRLDSPGALRRVQNTSQNSPCKGQENGQCTHHILFNIACQWYPGIVSAPPTYPPTLWSCGYSGQTVTWSHLMLYWAGVWGSNIMVYHGGAGGVTRGKTGEALIWKAGKWSFQFKIH